MFTGIVTATGTVQDVQSRRADRRIEIAAPGLDLAATGIGDSIAVNGCCLTVSALAAGQFCADVSAETLALTTLGQWQPGRRVNLEGALRAADALGGHLVSGHVDGVATVVSIRADGESWRLRITPPAALNRYIARKGSITLDGVSLTVNDVTDTDFGVNIVPHTFEHTVLGDYRPGVNVNIEVDLIARYIERLMENRL